MQALEVAIWSAMAGVLLTLFIAATLDVATRPSQSAARSWFSLVLTGGACILMSGLPEALLSTWNGVDWLPLKATLGPLCGALAMTYLGHWSGLRREDLLVRRIMGPGAAVLVAGTLVLLGLVVAGVPAHTVLLLTAAINSLAVLMGVLIAVRSVTLGDQLSRWMVLACLCLAQMTAGLYAKELGMDMGNVYWTLTACATVGYFATVIVLVRMRSRQLRRLRRQATGQMPLMDPLNLPCGVQLVTRVEDALWRSQRMGRPCLVVAVSVSNLYAYRESPVPDPVGEILVALSARIRQLVGFRNVVGLYHQRCFVLAISAVQDPQRAELVTERVLRELRMSVNVGPDPLSLPFQPEVAIGVVEVPARTDEAAAVQVINLAEQLALHAHDEPERALRRTWAQRPDSPVALASWLSETQPASL